MIEKAYGASIRGKYHIESKRLNQDAFLIQNTRFYTLVVVADGLGSKKHSRLGSRKICKSIKKEISLSFKHNNLVPDVFIDKVKKRWIKSLFPYKPRDCDTTCLAALISNKEILLLQLGDGKIIIQTNNTSSIVQIKDEDFINETKSVNRARNSDWHIEIIQKENEKLYSLVLCTDGISEDIIPEYLSDFMNESKKMIVKTKKETNHNIRKALIEWPNKHNLDDKTMVVIK